ncbi:hypothetical protein CAPTEDRAFT_214719 [Capitella teleta]|uniref:PiggyBac transposable element-derived protein domain-containing protein n=1 Tax=Capitella teleta TaxID=283909 RepID=R7TR72_CAPTE|nr:hypothetical protein CAPTEDRAFT_214719 [Capitella teleta]|eukprot:ELT96077.1 hypothetical protein CAPTEDRAFT_214719 [Capitella teleta]
MKPYAGVSSTIADTITNLLDRLAGHGHQLYMDNFYNSVKVTDILLNLKTHICGTMRANRGEPAAMKAPTLQKGETLALHNGRAMLLAWKDKRIVKMVSTFHDASMQDVELTIVPTISLTSLTKANICRIDLEGVQNEHAEILFNNKKVLLNVEGMISLHVTADDCTTD